MPLKNSNIPNSSPPIGARNLSKALTSLRLNQELIDYLSELDGELHIVLSPHCEGPSVRVAKRGKMEITLATTKEIERLSNYKAIIGKKLEENKKEEDLKEEIALYKNARDLLVSQGGTSPDRILEANEQRFRMTQRQVELVEKQVEVIETLPDSDEKKYIIKKARILIRILLGIMAACMGDNKVETETYHDLLRENGVPRWIEKKLLDANFTKDVRSSAKQLLFSKSNYMKSIGLTRKEINTKGFLAANEFITQDSGAILALAKLTTFQEWIFQGLNGDLDLLKENYDKFSWPMMGAGGITEILQPRVNRNKIIGFSIAQAPKPKPGQEKFRPETAHNREVREMNNKLGLLVSTMVDFFHFVPRVDDPFGDVWSQLFKDVTWVITPENHLYQHINNADTRDTVLGHIRENSLETTVEMMISIVLMNIKIPEGSTRGTKLRAILKSLGPNTIPTKKDSLKDLGEITKATDKLPEASIAILLDTSRYVSSDKSEILNFRGKHTTETRKGHKNHVEILRNLKQTSPLVAKKLKSIMDGKLRNEIASWIKENFRHKKLQLLALNRAIATISDQDLGYEELEYDSDDHTSDSE